MSQEFATASTDPTHEFTYSASRSDELLSTGMAFDLVMTTNGTRRDLA
jgi:hypothetical protein